MPPDAGVIDSHDRDALRRLVEIRCGIAEMAQREAEAADMRAADARRLAETQLAAVAETQLAADSAAYWSAKESAHKAFKEAVKEAVDHLAVEVAAEHWLTEINLINSGLHDAQLRLPRVRETADAAAAERDRLAAAADAARSLAEAARQACLEARHQLEQAGSEVTAEVEAAAEPETAAEPEILAEPVGEAERAPQVEVVRQPAPEAVSADSSAAVPAAVGDGLFLDLRSRPPQLVVRLLDRESGTLSRLVRGLAGGAADARSVWTLRLSNFVDATTAAAIDDACFDFPSGHPFWGMFTTEQARDIARSLAALGYRYDGLGEFIDDRVPDQRDLALAIGSAGLYQVRIRYWPHAGEYGELYRDIRVAAAVFLAERAPSLTLGELVVALGRRAELLADLWNDWPRVRPVLLSNPAD